MAGEKLQVLIVEDAPLPAKMAAVVLSKLNCDVTIATTGQEAISKFGDNTYSIIFMDLGLPDKDGLTVTEECRKMEEKTHTHTPIIALTAHITDEHKKSAIEAGMDDFLAKPLTEDKAREVIERYVHQSLSSAPRIR